MLHGVSKATFFILPMLGKHPDEYPRFRDCFLKDEDHPEYDYHILVYTRVGGNNRDCGFGEEILYEHPEFVTTYDDDYDNTYATYVFRVPEKWKEDFDKLVFGNIKDISKEYKDELCRVYPKLKNEFGKIFGEDKYENHQTS